MELIKHKNIQESQRKKTCVIQSAHLKFVLTDKQKHVMLFSLPLINFVYLQAKHTFFENLQCVKSVAYKSAHQENWKLFTSISIWNSADRHVSVNIHG